MSGESTRAPAPTESRETVPTLVEGRYVFQWGKRTFAVDPCLGGRITTFSLAGENMLTGPNTSADNWGSTFWTSPQADWGWPPPPEIDHAPYRVAREGPVLTLSGSVAPSLGLSVIKRFRVRTADGAVQIQYVIVNHKSAPVRVAPWEITRVPATGVTLFASDTAEYDRTLVGFVRDQGIAWFHFEPELLTSSQKFFGDGAEGWIAHADHGLLMLKTFDDVPPALQAPLEGEIEIYANADPREAHRYVEIEQQGAYTEIAPGDSLTWNVTWHLHELPPGLEAVIGSAKLAHFARTLARR